MQIVWICDREKSMIFYATKKTVERYKLPMPEDFQDSQARQLVSAVMAAEQRDRLLEWGCKIFYFDGRKCIQVVNFASKLTFFLVDVKMKDREFISNTIAHYMFDLYEGNKEMTALLERFFAEHPITVFAKLTDKSAIASLNHMETGFLMDGYRLYDYIEGGILHTRKLNKYVNQQYPVTLKNDGKTNYIFPAEQFEKLLKARYTKKKNLS